MNLFSIKPVFNKKLPSAILFFVLLVSNSVFADKLSLNKTTFTPGENITLSFNVSTELHKSSWVGMLPENIEHGSTDKNDQHDTTFQYVSGRRSGTMIFIAPKKQGDYDFRLNDTNTKKETATIKFKVRVDIAAASLTLPKAVFAPKEQITLSFKAASTYEKNTWVGMGPSNIKHGSTKRNDQHDLVYRYLKQRTSGSITFTAPTKQGQYDFRMNESTNDIELTSIAFQVKIDKNAAQLSLPRSVFSPAEKISLSFNASLTYAKNTWVGMGPANIEHGSTQQNDQHDMSYQYIENRTSGDMNFTAPSQPGHYDFRMNDTTNDLELVALAFSVSDNPNGGGPAVTAGGKTNTEQVQNGIPGQLAIVGDFTQRKGPFSNYENKVGDFSHIMATTQGIVASHPNGARAAGTMSPGDVDVVLFGLSENTDVKVTLRPCSKTARARLLDINGRELMTVNEISYGYYGLYGLKEITNLNKGAYALEIMHTGKTPCEVDADGWGVEVQSGKLIDPIVFVGPNEKDDKPDYSVDEDINVDGLIRELRSIIVNGK